MGMELIEGKPFRTQAPRRGRPLRRPARDALRVVAVGNVEITVYSLTRWMHRVRADAAGYYKTPA